jgi:hypothetical protein
MPEDNSSPKNMQGPSSDSLMVAYADFRKELLAIPSAQRFIDLFSKYGRVHGYKNVGRWVVGRPPRQRN